MHFDCLVHLVECQNISTTNCNLQKELLCVSSLGIFIILSAIVLSLWIWRLDTENSFNQNICSSAAIAVIIFQLSFSRLKFSSCHTLAIISYFSGDTKKKGQQHVFQQIMILLTYISFFSFFSKIDIKVRL